MTQKTRTTTSNTSLPGIFSCFKASLQAHLAFDHTLAAIWSMFLIGYLCIGYFDMTLPLSESLLRHTSSDTYFIHQGFMDKTYYFTSTLFFFFMNLRAFYGPTYVAQNMNDLMWRTLFIGLGVPYLVGLLCVALWFSLPDDIQSTLVTVVSMGNDAHDTFLFAGLFIALMGLCLYTLARFSLLFSVILETGKMDVKRALSLSKGHGGKLVLFLLFFFTLSTLLMFPFGFLGALDATAQINPNYTGPVPDFSLMGTWLWESTLGKVVTFGVSSFAACLIQSMTLVSVTFFYKAITARAS